MNGLMMRVMVVYSWFWFLGGVTLTAVNAYGRFQLGRTFNQPAGCDNLPWVLPAAAYWSRDSRMARYALGWWRRHSLH